MGGHHARTYSKTPGSKLVAVVDKDLERAKAIAELHGCRAVALVSEVIDDIAAATVAVPTVYHAEVTIPLLKRGIPVLVEKPLAPDTQSAKLILEASKEHRTLVQVGHSERFNPVVQAMLKMGVAPRYIEAQRISPFTFRSADVGVVLDMMIHDIDIVLHLVRQREYTVDAVGVRVLGASEDVANARIRFADGTVASLTASRLALKTDRRIRIFCPTAYISMDYQRKSGIAIKLHDNVDLIRLAKEKNFEDLSQMASMDFSSMLKVEPIVVNDVEPLQAEINAFLEAIRTGGQSAVTAEEGYAAVEMADRISRSIREQEWGAVLVPT
jgi:predicted dehydrogenase